MVNKYREDLRKNIKSYFINNETWNTPIFKFSDDNIVMDIFGSITSVFKSQTYSVVKYFSNKAEFHIEERMKKKGEDFYLAKDYVKFKKILPLLIKIRGWGWKEPTYEELDSDQKKRFTHHQKALRFSEKRNIRIEGMKEPTIEISQEVKDDSKHES